jgi:hypothetical protein
MAETMHAVGMYLCLTLVQLPYLGSSRVGLPPMLLQTIAKRRSLHLHLHLLQISKDAPGLLRPFSSTPKLPSQFPRLVNASSV